MNKREKRAAAAEVAAAAQTETVETPQAKPQTMAAFLDRLIAEGGAIEAIVAAAIAEGEIRSLRTKFNAGVIKGHINFRTKQVEKQAKKKAQEIEVDESAE